LAGGGWLTSIGWGVVAQRRWLTSIGWGWWLRGGGSEEVAHKRWLGGGGSEALAGSFDCYNQLMLLQYKLIALQWIQYSLCTHKHLHVRREHSPLQSPSEDMTSLGLFALRFSTVYDILACIQH